MNSLSTCSRIEVIEDLLQLTQAACAALVGILLGDSQSPGDLIRAEHLVGQFHYLTVFRVLDLDDCPEDQALLTLQLELVELALFGLLATACLPGGEGARVGANLAFGVEAVVKA